MTTLSPFTSLSAAGVGVLAPLFEYPREDLAARVDAARTALTLPADHTARPIFESFAGRILALAPERREELYTATFEIAPACIPYVSLQLFGEESFKRGAFMAALNARYAAAGFVTQGELPDHLTVILRFAGGVESAERRDLAEFCLLSPLAAMIRSLSEDHPYRELLECARQLLQAEFPGLEAAPSPMELSRQDPGACATTRGGACGCGPTYATGTGREGEPGFGSPSEVDDD